MSDILRRAFDRAVLAAERRAWTPGRLGMTNADGTVTISVPDRPNWVYVALGPDGSQGVTVARNDAGVPLRVYLPVKMRREESGVMAIQGVYNAGGLADVGASSEAIYTDYGTTPHKHSGDDIPDAVLIDGTRMLTANWDIGEARRILSDGLQARSAAGLRLEDNAGNLGVFIKDGGDVGIGTDSPASKLDVSGTLGVDGNATFSGNVGIGTASPAAMLDVNGNAIIRGPMYSTGPLGWKHSKTNVAHNTPTAIAKYTPSGSTASAVLVSIVATGTGILATKLFSVTTAWSTEVVTDLGGALYGFSGIALAADMNTTTMECTLTLTQTNSSALPANIYISIQPLATAGDAVISSFTGL